jgi:hypothetical protein
MNEPIVSLYGVDDKFRDDLLPQIDHLKYLARKIAAQYIQFALDNNIHMADVMTLWDEHTRLDFERAYMTRTQQRRNAQK